MQPFTYARVASRAEAIELARMDNVMLLAGGTELLNWMRIGIAEPARLLDISRLEDLAAIDELPGGGVRIGALVTLNDVALHHAIRSAYPVLSQAILQAASAQIRNLATIGGNPVQRTRCPYFRSEEPTPCNRRMPGSGCAALHGLNERHAIFGWTEACVATQPSDPAVALAALDAAIVTDHAEGGRRIPTRAFHILPGEDPVAHTILRHGELITAIELGAPAPRSAYVKVRERQSYEYALVSAAAIVELDGATITRARLALGSVAMRPWRLDDAERRLVGLDIGDADALRAAIAASFHEARALSSNAYKIPLARNTALRALQLAARMA